MISATDYVDSEDLEGLCVRSCRRRDICGCRSRKPGPRKCRFGMCGFAKSWFRKSGVLVIDH